MAATPLMVALPEAVGVSAGKLTAMPLNCSEPYCATGVSVLV